MANTITQEYEQRKFNKEFEHDMNSLGGLGVYFECEPQMAGALVHNFKKIKNPLMRQALVTHYKQWASKLEVYNEHLEEEIA